MLLITSQENRTVDVIRYLQAHDVFIERRDVFNIWNLNADMADAFDFNHKGVRPSDGLAFGDAASCLIPVVAFVQ
jgi:hypothetical protein